MYEKNEPVVCSRPAREIVNQQMRAFYRLVKMNLLPFIEPIIRGVRNNILMSKFVMQHYHSLIITGLPSGYFLVLYY